jgi:nucleotide-binding universal stress UspA family protein
MIDRLLIAVDGSECARRAAGVGLDMAAACDAAVTVLFVVPPDVPDDDGASVREHGTTALEAVASDARDRGIDVETRLDEGTPAATIAERVADLGADAVVVGRRGADSLGKRLLGSVPRALFRRVEVPVLTVPETATPADGIGDVLVTTDGSEAATAAAPYAATIARGAGGRLHLLSVVDVAKAAGAFNAGGVSPEYVDRLREAAGRDLDALAAATGELGGVEVRREVTTGRAHEGITTYVEDAGIDLVAMASKGQTGLAGQLLGTVTERVLRTSSAPVLVVPVS